MPDQAEEPEHAIRLLCVDDNARIVEALRLLIAHSPRYEWTGSLASADDLLNVARVRQPDVILLDVDMPGRDPFEVVNDLATHCPEQRVIMLSGHVRKELVSRAISAGAWGYVAKADGERATLNAIGLVAGGEVVLSPEVQSCLAL
jgi:DNA-binding NarL/FixJ family response regulator